MTWKDSRILLLLSCLICLIAMGCASDDDEDIPYEDGDEDTDLSEAWEGELPLPDNYDSDGDEEIEEIDEQDDSIPDYGCDLEDPDELRAIACQMLHHINQDREMFPEESNNAQPIMWDEMLVPVTLAHSQDMCDRLFFDHVNPDGQDPFDRIREAGVPYRSAGENIAYGPDALDTQYRFMAECICTENHRSNVLNPTFRHVGIGIIRCDHATNGMRGDYYYVTQNFRSFMTEPVITVPYCKQEENINRYWEEPASSAPISDYFGPSEPGSDHYTTCEGDIPSDEPPSRHYRVR